MAKRGGKRRDPAREKFWRRTIRDQERSGLSVRDFCGREGLKDWTFRWWRVELGRRDRQPSAAFKGERQGEPTEAATAFLPVRVVDLEVVSPRPAPPIEILLPTGMIVRVPSGFDPPTLGRVLAVLEGRPC
jgi:transposase